MNITDGFGAVVAWIVAGAAGLTALGVIGKASRRGWMRVVGTTKKPGWMRRLVRVVDELHDLPATVRVLAAEQAATAADVLIIKKEMKPNGGSSLRDSNNRIETALGTIPTPTQEEA